MVKIENQTIPCSSSTFNFLNVFDILSFLRKTKNWKVHDEFKSARRASTPMLSQPYESCINEYGHCGDSREFTVIRMEIDGSTGTGMVSEPSVLSLDESIKAPSSNASHTLGDFEVHALSLVTDPVLIELDDSVGYVK